MPQNFIPVDLHCHSNYSDGALPVNELISLAAANGGRYLALTDHDTVSGIKEARLCAAEAGINLIAGVEISVTWQNNCLLHILGLGIDENNQQLIDQLNHLQQNRLERGHKIAESLAKAGIADAFNGAMAYCTNPQALSRTHFAQFLVANGHAKHNRVFDQYLTSGKPGYVMQTWASLADAVAWIINSGGVAVIAHPARYKLSKSKIINLITEFKSYGGTGMEVISSSHSLSDEHLFGGLCKATNLLASIGSDFHRADHYRKIKVGINKTPPDNLPMIFDSLGISLSC